MRIHEIITEAISLTDIEQPLRKSILSELGFAVRQMYYKEKTIPQEVRDKVNSGVHLSPIIPYLEKLLEEQVNLRVSATIEAVLKGMPEVDSAADIHVYFTNTNANGQVDGLTMLLSNNYVSNIVTVLVRYWLDYTLADLDPTDDVVSQIFFMSRAMKPPIPEDGHQLKIDDLCETVVHEAVHIVQHYKQTHRDKTEYRSYLEKDPEKFAAAMQRVASAPGGLPADDPDYRIYRASPQEITAFAHQKALELIRYLELDDLSLEELVDAKKELPEIFLEFGDDIFRNSALPQEQRIHRRFMKIMAQEVVRRFDHRFKQLNKHRSK